jgi:hypothetical protein
VSRVLESITYFKSNMVALKIRTTVLRRIDKRPIPPPTELVEDAPTGD